MTEFKQLPRESSLKFIESIKESSMTYKKESEELSVKLLEVAEKKNLLESAWHKTDRVKVKNAITELIHGLETEEENLTEERDFYSNKSYQYQQVGESLDKALKEF